MVARYAIGGIVLGWPLGPDGQTTLECTRVAVLADRLAAHNVS